MNKTDRHGTCEDDEEECDAPDLDLCDINPLDPTCQPDTPEIPNGNDEGTTSPTSPCPPVPKSPFSQLLGDEIEIAKEAGREIDLATSVLGFGNAEEVRVTLPESA